MLSEENPIQRKNREYMRGLRYHLLQLYLHELLLPHILQYNRLTYFSIWCPSFCAFSQKWNIGRRVLRAAQKGSTSDRLCTKSPRSICSPFFHVLFVWFVCLCFQGGSNQGSSYITTKKYSYAVNFFTFFLITARKSNAECILLGFYAIVDITVKWKQRFFILFIFTHICSYIYFFLLCHSVKFNVTFTSHLTIKKSAPTSSLILVEIQLFAKGLGGFRKYVTNCRGLRKTADRPPLSIQHRTVRSVLWKWEKCGTITNPLWRSHSRQQTGQCRAY